MTQGITAAHDMTEEVAITPGFTVTICDKRAVDLGRAVALATSGEDGWRDLPEPIMGAEDFAYLLEKVPGAMFFLGAAPQGQDWHSGCGIHSARMHVDEGALPIGTAMLAGCALRFLERGFD